jgi:hypothetical protein
MTSKIPLYFQELTKKVKKEYCSSLFHMFNRWSCRNGVDNHGELVIYQIKGGKSNQEICERFKVC